MGKLIDASVLIAAERGQLDLAAARRQHAREPCAISAVTASEMLHGTHRLKDGGKRARQQAFIENILSQLPVLPFDLLAARVHARLWAELAASGRSVGERDLLIAATALSRDYGVVTRDERSFPRISGLSIERW